MPNIEVLRKKCDKAAAELKLEPEHVKMLQNCAHAIYEEIGGDLEPDHKRCGTCKRSTILEVVTDAGRLEQEVRRRLGSGLRERPRLDLDGHPLVQACGRYDLIDDLIGPAFPYSEYEVGCS
jgi:hypothetical protein